MHNTDKKVVHLKRKSAVNVSLFCIWINNLCVQTENLTAFKFLITIIYHSISRNLGRVECLTQSANELCQIVVRGLESLTNVLSSHRLIYKVTLLSWPFAWVRHFQDVYVCDSSKDLSKRTLRVDLKERIVFFSLQGKSVFNKLSVGTPVFCNQTICSQAACHKIKLTWIENICLTFENAIESKFIEFLILVIVRHHPEISFTYSK